MGVAMMLLMYMFIAAGTMLALLSVPLLFDKIGPNPWYGFRVRATLENRDVWFAVNRFAARGLFCVGLITVAVAIGLAKMDIARVDVYATSCAAVVLGALAVNLVMSISYLKTLQK